MTDKQYQDLRRLQKGITDTRNYLLKCQKCRLDVQQELATTEEQLEIIKSIIREFFPDKPSEL